MGSLERVKKCIIHILDITKLWMSANNVSNVYLSWWTFCVWNN